MGNKSTSSSEISIVIPTLNEEICIQQTIKAILKLRPEPYEVIVVDGGSKDRTCELVSNMGVKLIQTEIASRPLQLNKGAAVSTGEILCFVHADTILPEKYVEIVRHTLKDQGIAAGGFFPLIKGPTRIRWGTSMHNFLKTYYVPLLFRPYRFLFKGLRLLFGDQTIFCRKRDFMSVGGFNPKLPIMEETDFCDKIGKKGRIVQLYHHVQTSDRRITKWGSLKANGIFLFIGFLWGFGVSAQFLKRFYPDIR